VRARVFLETRFCEEISGGLAPLKYSKGGEVKFLCRRISSRKRTLVYFIEVLEEEIEWSEFSMEKYRRLENR
jgi:hypothetical protein